MATNKNAFNSMLRRKQNVRARKPEQCLTAATPVNLGKRLAKATAAIFTSVNVDKSGNTRQQPLSQDDCECEDKSRQRVDGNEGWQTQQLKLLYLPIFFG